ncbi:MAG: hypothetical protein BWY09_00134 [Candidatus Hydrogenedentes bacterium ADurb.Bin179]|nr:MAG: hypothetical protein BWY09_00134 [Candidatus Hydrogenedentes bacterium ADurb.Bin179]
MTKTKHLVLARHEAIASQNGLAASQIASCLAMTSLWVAGNARDRQCNVHQENKEVIYVPLSNRYRLCLCRTGVYNRLWATRG